MYTYNDIFFSPKGYIWVGMWYTLCVVDSVPMTTWSRTYYNVRIPASPLLARHPPLSCPMLLTVALSACDGTSMLVTTIFDPKFCYTR
jgi:hypothetical protein